MARDEMRALTWAAIDQACTLLDVFILTAKEGRDCGRMVDLPEIEVGCALVLSELQHLRKATARRGAALRAGEDAACGPERGKSECSAHEAISLRSSLLSFLAYVRSQSVVDDDGAESELEDAGGGDLSDWPS